MRSRSSCQEMPTGLLVKTVNLPTEMAHSTAILLVSLTLAGASTASGSPALALVPALPRSDLAVPRAVKRLPAPRTLQRISKQPAAPAVAAPRLLRAAAANAVHPRDRLMACCPRPHQRHPAMLIPKVDAGATRRLWARQMRLPTMLQTATACAPPPRAARALAASRQRNCLLNSFG